MEINSLDKLIKKADKILKKYCSEHNVSFYSTKEKIEKHIDPHEELRLLDFYLDYYNHVKRFYKL